MSFDWTQARNDMQAIIADNPVSIAFRRGVSTVTAQTMRVEIAGARGVRLQSDAARQAQQAAFVLGAYNMDVAIDDRFTYSNILYKVVYVQPNRLACTIAEAIVIE